MAERRDHARELEERMRDVERIANEARTEFRAISGELKAKFERLDSSISAKIDTLKDSIATFKIRTLSDDKKDRREFRVTLTHIIIGIAGILVYGAVMPMVLNWDRVESMWASIETHFRKAGETKVPLMLDMSKKPRRHHVKKKLPPVVIPDPEPGLQE